MKQHSTNRIFIEHFKEISNNSVLLFRPIHINDLDKADLLNNSEYIFSQWEGYWIMDANAYLRDWLTKNGIKKTSIHTSGHASISELKLFANSMAPKRIVPIHTFSPERYEELFNNVELHNDGEYWEV